MFTSFFQQQQNNKSWLINNSTRSFWDFFSRLKFVCCSVFEQEIQPFIVVIIITIVVEELNPDWRGSPWFIGIHRCLLGGPCARHTIEINNFGAIDHGKKKKGERCLVVEFIVHQHSSFPFQGQLPPFQCSTRVCCLNLIQIFFELDQFNRNGNPRSRSLDVELV